MAGFKQIKIFTDTNIVHTAQAHLLISSAVHKYVSEHKNIESVELKWFLPSMVLEERRHQMLAAAKGLSPKLGELEKLLDHSLGITPEIMLDRVNAKISKTIEKLGIEICELDIGSVDWKDLIDRSAHREPPFEISNEKEKGFRDAIIATTFLQEIERSPKTPRSCLLVFVSGDNRVKEYLKDKAQSADNVRILDSLDELKNLLNAIASEVTEEFLESIYSKAKLVFYDFRKSDGLYLKEGVYTQITEQCADELNLVTSGFPGSIREATGTTIGNQTFIKKTGQTIVWSMPVNLKFEIVKYDLGDTDGNKGLLGLPSGVSKVITTGVSNFSAVWQHQINIKGNITRAKINSIEFIENVFYSDIAF
jgi:hypothetical protein